MHRAIQPYLPAAIFLGILLVVVVILLFIQYCLKNDMCCCQKKQRSEIEYDPIMDNDIYEDDYQPPDFDSFKPTKYIDTTDDEELTDATDFHYDGDREILQDKKISSLKKSSSVSLLSLVSKELYLENTKIKLSLLYSKPDLFLMATVNEVSGIPTKIEKDGFEFIRVSIALLPHKKYRSKTRYEFVTENTTLFSDTFKFSNVARETLFSSAFRFRLYGKQKLKRDVCLGETIVQLADVAQRAGGFLTWRNFEPVKH